MNTQRAPRPAAKQSAQIHVLAAYRHQWWLKTPHGSSPLIADFADHGRYEVNLDIVLASGMSLMTNKRLTSEVYDYLCTQAIVGPSERPRAAKTLKEHFTRALCVLDYLFLNDESGEIASFGLGAVTTQKLNQLLLDIASHRTTNDAVYGFSTRLREYLLDQASAISDDAIVEAFKKRRLPMGKVDTPRELWKLTQSEKELLRVRAYLLIEGLYKSTPSIRASSKLVPRSAELARRIFRNTLYGANLRMVVQDAYPELCIGTNSRYQREHRAVPVWSGRADQRAGVSRLQEFTSKVQDFRRLSDLGMGVPSAVLDAVADISAAVGTPGLKDIDGVNPAPPQAVARAVHAAVDFFYEHGEHLLTSATQVMRASTRLGVAPVELSSDVFQDALHPATREFGVCCWGLHRTLYERSFGTWPSSGEYLDALRGGTRGLWDMVVCLFGGALLVVGVTQAAREGELSDLRAADISRAKWLRTLTRKSETPMARRQDYRPLPAVSEQMLQRFAEFQAMVGQPDLPLFSYPSLGGGLRRATSNTTYGAIDRFVDYIEGDCDSRGHRYYLRPHQLRGFFAEAFFYCFGFAGLDTLQWFLRHLDPQHVWEYVEHTTPGKVLRRHKSVAAATLIRAGSHDLDALVLMVRQHFQVRSIELLHEDELADLIDELQRRELVSISPVFGHVAGKSDFSSMRLGVVIRGASK